MAGRRVLVVDDDPAIRRLVASVLVEAGYDAQTAVDGDHALRSALALHPDLIVLDINVPDKAMALRFAQAYRERVLTDTRAPIIALSGSSDLLEVGQQLGADGFLPKPFNIDELLRLVTKFLPEPVLVEAPVVADAEVAAAPEAVPENAATVAAPIVAAAAPIAEAGTSNA